MKTGTVHKPLSPGEAFEFGAAVMQQLGRDIDPDKARYYINNKSKLGKDLRKLGIHKVPEFDVSKWEIFYKTHFGYAGGFENLHIPQKPDYTCRAIVIVPSITNNQVFDACTKAFGGKTWRYERNLDTVRDVVVRPQAPYVVWVRDVVEADEEMKNKSADDVEAAQVNAVTLKERMVLELAYFDETGKHLDIENWTLCAGSRYADGSVPRCGWGGAEFFVSWAYRDYHNSFVRARVAVS